MSPEKKTGEARILVVEDEVLLAFDLEDHLMRAGFTVAGPALSVAQALTLAHKGDIDAAILDVHLGDETSESVALELLKRHTPFLTLTGYAPEQRPAAFNDSPTLSKPVDIVALLAELRRCLGKSAP